MNPFALPCRILHNIHFSGGAVFRSSPQSKAEREALQRFVNQVAACGVDMAVFGVDQLIFIAGTGFLPSFFRSSQLLQLIKEEATICIRGIMQFAPSMQSIMQQTIAELFKRIQSVYSDC